MLQPHCSLLQDTLQTEQALGIQCLPTRISRMLLKNADALGDCVDL